MYKLIIATVIISVLSSCSDDATEHTKDALKSSQPTVFINNIETDSYWNGQVTFKKVTNAHSGDMVSIIDDQKPYSIGFHHKLIDLPDTAAKKASISAWVNYADTINAKIVLVISIDNLAEGKNISWLGMPVEKISKIIPNQWVKITWEYTLPKTKLSGNENLGIYFWNQSKVPVMIDDLEVKFF